VTTLRRKLWRDLARLKAQVLTIALVVGSGIASQIAAVSTFQALVYSRDSYYRESRFANVFAHVQSAPTSVLGRIREVSGVASAEGQIVREERVEVQDFPEPVRARFVSLTERPQLNLLFLRRGRLPERGDELVASELFARAHNLVPGSSITALIEGRRMHFRIVGIGLSPEYVWILPPGGIFSDDLRYGVLWIQRRALASAVRMEERFNDLCVALAPGASEPGVIDALDRLLEPYGSYGAYGRDRQGSSRLVEQELQQLQGMSTVPPLIFLGVAAFLLNVLLSRIVLTQREQIATLKALGYTRGQLAWHYTQFALVVVVLGTILGLALGSWAGSGFVQLYTRYFRFPVLHYRFDPAAGAQAFLVSAVAGLCGAALAVRRVLRLAPAEAMRPEAPPSYRSTLIERTGLSRLLSVESRMVLRDLERQPGRVALSAVGIAFATAIVIAGNMGFDTVDEIFATQFDQAQQEDLAVSLTRALPLRVAYELERIPGVQRAEPRWLIPVRLHGGPVSRDTVLTSNPAAGGLRRILDRRGREVPLPDRGIVLSRILAQKLSLRPGDAVQVETLEEKQRVRAMVVADLVDDVLGMSAYATAEELARLTGNGPSTTEVLLVVDRRRLDDVVRRVSAFPQVSAVRRPETVREEFRKQAAESFLTMQTLLAVFAAVIAVGVVYNNARIALAVRSRDLATLRILGFRRGEVATILFGEQAAQLLLGVPAGIPLGRWLGSLVLGQTDPELFRLPVVMSARTATSAALIVLMAGVLSAVLVQLRARRLDLIAVLKARD
jgi:putative ABC transport system permease protein